MSDRQCPLQAWLPAGHASLQVSELSWHLLPHRLIPEGQERSHKWSLQVAVPSVGATHVEQSETHELTDICPTQGPSQAGGAGGTQATAASLAVSKETSD